MDASRFFADYTADTIGSTSLPQVAEVFVWFQKDDETIGEASIRWYQLDLESGAAPSPRLEVWDDSWATIRESGLVDWLASQDDESVSPETVKSWLRDTGYTEDPPVATAAENLTVRLALAKDGLRRAQRILEPVLLEHIRAEVLASFPDADTLHVRGEYNEDSGFIVRAQETTADGDRVAGWHVDSDAWEELTNVIDDELDQLGDLTGEAYLGDHEIELRGMP